jgi:hypothetical protein
VGQGQLRRLGLGLAGLLWSGLAVGRAFAWQNVRHGSAADLALAAHHHRADADGGRMQSGLGMGGIPRSMEDMTVEKMFVVKTNS